MARIRYSRNKHGESATKCRHGMVKEDGTPVMVGSMKCLCCQYCTEILTRFVECTFGEEEQKDEH